MRRDDDARQLAQAMQFLVERGELPEFQMLSKENQAAVIEVIPLINSSEKRAALALLLEFANTTEKRERMASGLAFVGFVGRIRGVGRLLARGVVQVALALALLAALREDAKDLFGWLSGFLFSGKP